MRTLFLIFASLLMYVGVFAQSYVPPSADAMGLARLASTPVNYYTGTPVISVPLTQVSGKELSIPIGLSYNSSGIKVQDIAGSSGLGWSPNFLGVITRVMKGIPDELPDGYCGTNNRIESALTSPDYQLNVGAGVWDGEPDLFFFSIPGGRSGKFFLDEKGIARTIPHQAITIKPAICPYGSGSWEIIDENGTRYLFGTVAGARETTTTRLVTQSTNQHSYVSSWYITQIISANNTDQLTFSYTQSNYSYINYSYSKFDGRNPCGDGALKDESISVTVSAKYLTTITSSLGTLYLTWKGNREDITGALYLSDLRLVNSENIQLTKFRFEYTYFRSSSGCSEQLCKRLRLDKIYDLAPDPLFTFGYNLSEDLPPRNSKNFDHWGFYNNNTYDSWLPEYSDTEGSYTAFYPGATREPDPVKGLANMLIEIQNRNGAFQRFEYEGHQGNFVNALRNAGGARIKKISTTNEYGNELSRNFYYTKENSSESSGLVPRIPVYGISIFDGTIKRHSSSPIELYDLNGTHIGYSRVIERIPGGGETIYYFSNFDTNPDESPAWSTQPDLNGPPFVSKTSHAWERGNIIKTELKDANTNLLLTQYNEYNLSYTSVKISRFYSVLIIPCVFTNTFDAASDIISKPFTLKKQTTEIHDPSDASKKMTRVTEYEYDPVTYLPLKTITYDASQTAKKYITQTSYVTDNEYDYCAKQHNECVAYCDATYDQITQEQLWYECHSGCQTMHSNCQNQTTGGTGVAGAITLLRNRHQIATPVETLSLLQEGTYVSVLSSSVNIFNAEGPSGTHVHLKETWGMKQLVPETGFVKSKTLGNGTFEFDPRLRKLHTNNTFDQTTGNLLQQTSFGGIQTNYTWGHNNTLVTSTTVTGGVNTRTTSATFKPLVGTLSTTDANGRTTHQEYDVYNRPTVTKDHDGNILGRTRYHYKGESPGFSISANRTTGLTGDFYSFYVSDIAAAAGGTPRWVWDFGDGTVVDNNSTYISHNYTQPGNYTVKLTGLNPEYGPATRTIQMNIYSPMSATTCENGPVQYDFCYPDEAVYGACTPDPPDQYAPVVITVNVSNGCSASYSYSWRYRNNTYPYQHYWYALNSTSSSVTFYPPGLGHFDVECTITDACYNTTVVSSYITRYKSDSDCPEY